MSRVYNGFRYLEERKAALEVWGNFVDGLVNGRVAPLQRKSA